MIKEWLQTGFNFWIKQILKSIIDSFWLVDTLLSQLTTTLSFRFTKRQPLIALAYVIFQMDLVFGELLVWEKKHIDFNIAMILCVSIACMLKFAYCFFGMLATGSFGSLTGTLYESNWLKFSTELLKNLIIMIGNMHRPLCCHGFSVTVSNLQIIDKLYSQILAHVNSE